MSSARLTPASSAARLWEMRPWAYQRIAAAKRISWATSSGDLRRVEKTSESNSTWTRVIIVLLLRHRPHGIIPAERLAALNEPTAWELRIKVVEMRERGLAGESASTTSPDTTASPPYPGTAGRTS